MKIVSLSDIQMAWAARYLPHYQQRLDNDCSKTCLKMLAPLAHLNEAAELPSVIPTSEMQLRAVQLGIFLEQQPITSQAFTFGTYLLLRKHHWFIVQFRCDDEVLLHDPSMSRHQVFTAHEFNRLDVSDCAAIFRVLWTSMP